MKTEVVRAIRSKIQYEEYLRKIDQLMDGDPSSQSEDGQLLETLTILVEDYERKKG